MAGRKSDFTLPKFDDIFSTQEMRDDEKLAKIRDIPLELIDDFPDHPYKVRDDEDMMQLVESIKERGVITPATVRQKEDGRYELISGHRRKRASELAGFETLRCEVVELDRDDATILMVESNLQRSVILPSEKAYAYKMRLDAMKRKAGRPSKENLVPVGQNFSREQLAEQTGESQTQIQRFIRLTNLVPELLEFVDEGKMKMRPAVELSYLDEDCQRDLVDEIDLNDCTPSHDQTIRIPESQSAVIEWNKVTEKSFENILKKWRADVYKLDSELADKNGGSGVPVKLVDGDSDEMIEKLGGAYGKTQGDATLGGAVYGVYKGETLVDIYTTDENGYFITDYYVCGDDWSIREITPSEGYLLDTTIYHIDCSAENYTVELNTEYPDVYENIIKGNIAIIKHTDDGSTKIETPEEGAKFEIFLKAAGSYKNASMSLPSNMKVRKSLPLPCL